MAGELIIRDGAAFFFGDDNGDVEATGAPLMRSDMFNGGGIRSLSAEDAGYNPLGYHSGTVWPHDTALIAEGMRRYGLRQEASRLAVALLEAAEEFEHQLPEVFAGFPCDAADVPVAHRARSGPRRGPRGAADGAADAPRLGRGRRRAQGRPEVPEVVGRLELCGLRFRARTVNVTG